MIRLTTTTFQVFGGPTAEDVVDAMMNASPIGAEGPPSRYMAAVGALALLWNQSLIRSNDAVCFLRDLDQVGLALVEWDISK